MIVAVVLGSSRAGPRASTRMLITPEKTILKAINGWEWKGADGKRLYRGLNMGGKMGE